MNKQRRKELSKIVSELEGLQERLGIVLSDEQDAYSNMPDSLKEGEKGIAMDMAVDSIAQAMADVETAFDGLLEIAGDA